MRSPDRVQWAQYVRWVRSRPWQMWAAAGAVFALFAVLGAVTQGPQPVTVGARALADGLERATGAAPTAAGSEVPAGSDDAGGAGAAYPAPAGSRSAVPSTPSPTPSGPAYYASCAVADAAGVAPIRRGEPGYRSALDRDGDGIACDAADTTVTSAPAPSGTSAPPSPTVTPGPDPSPTPTASPTPTPEPSESLEPPPLPIILSPGASG